MDIKLDPELVRLYRDRWQAVAEIEANERRLTTMEERLLHADSLIAFVRAAHIDVSAGDRDEEVARERWAKLYAAMGIQ
jgi:hypothetical protein